MDTIGQQLELLYHSRYSGFRHGIVTIVGSYDEAHDAVQDGFARAFAERHRFQGGSLEAWVWRIVVRKALDARRRRRHASLGEAFDPSFMVTDRDPELVSALRTLSPRRRLIVFLRYFADLSYEEIADLCGLNVGTVSATLAQSLALLRGKLEVVEVEH